jgi:hypothetical protein
MHLVFLEGEAQKSLQVTDASWTQKGCAKGIGLGSVCSVRSNGAMNRETEQEASHAAGESVRMVFNPFEMIGADSPSASSNPSRVWVTR